MAVRCRGIRAIRSIEARMPEITAEARRREAVEREWEAEERRPERAFRVQQRGDIRYAFGFSGIGYRNHKKETP